MSYPQGLSRDEYCIYLYQEGMSIPAISIQLRIPKREVCYALNFLSYPQVGELSTEKTPKNVDKSKSR